jgi:NitT/TauT family transport system ATP-binding protein
VTPSPDAASGAAPIVVLEGVAKTYDRSTHALADVDVRVRRGEFLTLVGPSGCGKSTLLRLIAGLARPSAGTIRWWGEPRPDAAGQRTAFVFQAPTLMPWASVATNVRLPLDLAHVARVDADPRVHAALQTVGLEEAATRLPRELSGGMQMRASIARALVTKPALLLMDEPFGALDEFTRQRLDDELLDLWRTQALTVVFVTHSLQEAVFLSTRVVVMAAHPGRIIETCCIEEPYPRDEAFRVSTAFARYAARLSASIAKASASAIADAYTKGRQ